MTKIDSEIEVKFFQVDLEDIRKKLRMLNAERLHDMRLMRRVVYGGEANPDMQCTYGRIRDEGDAITMSAKYSAQRNDIASQKEAVIKIDNFEQAQAILDSFGLVMTDYQENKRETWRVDGDTLVELEEWPNLPTYIEIESTDIDRLKAVAEKLDLDWGSHTVIPTDKLYMQHHGWEMSEARKRLSDLHFN